MFFRCCLVLAFQTLGVFQSIYSEEKKIETEIIQEPAKKDHNDRGIPPQIETPVPLKTSIYEKIPRNRIPNNRVPKNSLPQASIPKNAIPDNKIPKNKIPGNRIPRNRLQRNQIKPTQLPRNSIPRGKLPRGKIQDDRRVRLNSRVDGNTIKTQRVE